MKNCLGIDVGGGSIKAAVVSESGDILAEDKEPTIPGWDNQTFLEALGKLVSRVEKKHPFESIGIGSPGPIDTEKGLILESANMKGLENVPLVSFLNQFGLPVFFNNDGNCAAMGEYVFGSGKGVANLVAITLGTGIGGGWVRNGKLFTGYKGNSMEIGHTTIVRGGALCGCGHRGCAESYFSATGFLNRMQDRTGKRPESAETFFAMVRSGDSDAEFVLADGIGVFAELLRNLIHSINPNMIVLLGGLTQSFDLFGDKLKEMVDESIFPVYKDSYKLVAGGQMSGTRGAAALSWENRR